MTDLAALRGKIAEVDKLLAAFGNEEDVRNAFALLLSFVVNWKRVQLTFRPGKQSEEVDELKRSAPFLAALCRFYEDLAEGLCGLEPAEAKELDSCLRRLAERAAILESQHGRSAKMVTLEESVFGMGSLKRGVSIPLHTLVATAAGLDK